MSTRVQLVMRQLMSGTLSGEAVPVISFISSLTEYLPARDGHINQKARPGHTSGQIEYSRDETLACLC